MGLALFAVGAVALAFLPSLGLTLDFDRRNLIASLLLLVLTVCCFARLWKLCRMWLGDGLVAAFAFLCGIMVSVMAAGAFPAAALMILAAGAIAAFVLARAGMEARTAPTGPDLVLLAAFLACCLFLLPSYLVKLDTYEYTGAFFVQILLPLKKFSDLIYHHALVSSILTSGIASTGLNGAVPDAYYVGGHYFMAGVMRLLHLPVETAPGVVSRAVGSAIGLTGVMFGAYCLRRMVSRDSQLWFGATATALTAGMVWMIAERASSVFASFIYSRLGILTSAVALPAAALLFVFAAVLSIASPQLRKELLSFRYVLFGLALLVLACSAKISSGMIAYSVVGAGYGLVFLLTADRRDGFIKAATWIVGGAAILYLAYRHVSVMGATRDPFNMDVAATMFRQTRGWMKNGVYACATSLILWAGYALATRSASPLSLTRLAIIHLVSPLACLVVLASTVVERRMDIAYFWISSIQISFFSAVIATSLLVALLMERVVWTSAAKRVGEMRMLQPVVLTVLLVAIATGTWSLHGKVTRQEQRMKQQLCDLLGQKNCAVLDGASADEILRMAAPLTPAARIAYLARSRGLAFDPNALLVIDKQSGFFRSDGNRNLLMNGCYYEGWSLYTMTGVPQAWGIPQGSKAEGLCETPPGGEADLWRRYGHGSYLPGTGTAKQHSPDSLRAACKQEAFRHKRFFYIDAKLRATIIDCATGIGT